MTEQKFKRAFSDIEIMAKVGRLQAGGKPVNETKTDLIVTLRLLHKAYAHIAKQEEIIARAKEMAEHYKDSYKPRSITVHEQYDGFTAREFLESLND